MLFGKKKSARVPSLSQEAIRPVVDQAVQELRDMTAALDAIVRFRKAQWEIDQDAGEIRFIRRDGMVATAPVQIIGTFNTADDTFLWAWDHPSIEQPLRAHAQKVREYGQRHGIEVLTARKVQCTQDDCWEFTALACKLNSAQGAYRGPAGTAMVFVTFGELALSMGGGAES